MALEGTLKDFGLADIFQLIGLQKKTGVLHLKGPEETVRVYFLDGKIVSADSDRRRLEDLLGTLLVKRGHLRQEQLQATLAKQKKTLQRLGHIFVNDGLVKQEDLRDALRIQITQILYRLFRWKDGDYSFRQEDTIDYDRENFAPLSPESVLLEGMQVIDEWPIIEKRIRSFDMVFEKVEVGAEVKIEQEDGADGRSILDDDDIDFGFTESKEIEEGAEAIRLTAAEGRVYHLVDGKTTVQDIIYRSRLTEFEACKVLYDLSTRQLIREVTAPGRPVAARAVRREAQPPSVALTIGGYALVLVLAAISFYILPMNPISVVGWSLNPRGEVQAFLHDWSKGRLDRIDYAIQVYQLVNGRPPADLESLVVDGYLRPGGIRDPWGQPFELIPKDGGYALQGSSGTGQPTELLRIDRTTGQ